MDTEIIRENVSEERKSSGKFMYKAIIIILIIIILLLLFWLGRTRLKVNKLKNKSDLILGNSEVFDIRCDSNCNCDVQDGKLTNTPKLSITNPKYGNWDRVNELHIFENPIYNSLEKIAPTSSNSYKFKVRNKTGNKVNYIIDFLEKNTANINMKYRLRKNDKYLAGSDSEWVNFEKLQIKEEGVASKQEDVYTLDWKWFESDNDTQIGNDVPPYSIHINIMAEQMV